LGIFVSPDSLTKKPFSMGTVVSLRNVDLEKKIYDDTRCQLYLAQPHNVNAG